MKPRAIFRVTAFAFGAWLISAIANAQTNELAGIPDSALAVVLQYGLAGVVILGLLWLFLKQVAKTEAVQGRLDAVQEARIADARKEVEGKLTLAAAVETMAEANKAIAERFDRFVERFDRLDQPKGRA